MHEIALSISSRSGSTPKYDYNFPTGSFVVVCSECIKRRKWFELVADLASPEKRTKYSELIARNTFVTAKQWDIIVGAWNKEVYDAYHEWGRMPEGSLKDLLLPATWNNLIERQTGWRDALGKEYTGSIDLCDTHIWSIEEYKRFLIITNTDSTDAEIIATEGVFKDETETKPVLRPKYTLDWERSVSLSTKEIQDIKDESITVAPIFDRPVLKTSAIDRRSIVAEAIEEQIIEDRP